MENEINILVVDDEKVMLDVLSQLLGGEGYNVDAAVTGKGAIEKVSQNNYNLLIQDIMLPDINGLEVLQRIKKIKPNLPVIMITAHGSIESAVKAMKMGAREYVTKPFNNDEVLLQVQRAIELQQLQQNYKNLLKERESRFGFKSIIGKDPTMLEIFDMIKTAAPSKSTVLIEGESGTGKELIAGAIHMNSNRANEPFIIVNTSTIPQDLLEATLFGHTKGAFTGAVAAKKGLLETADGGTIFLDEIGNISFEVQAKLLRAIQEKSFIPVGSTDTVLVDVRFIAATNLDLEKAMKEGKFREDLFFRLNVINIRVPPLRERKDDIPLLVHHFIEKYCKENEKELLDLEPEVLEALANYNWPGNIRELENVIERGTVLAKSNVFTMDLLPEYIKGQKSVYYPNFVFPRSGLSIREEVEKLEINLIKEALKLTGGIQKEAAKLLSLRPTTLHEKIRRLGITINNKIEINE